ncbi:MAG: hypothetical protein HQK51_01120 [Oligoflexia bacterium]|nr:hypothetical protein [Oligoflexia bacterium]
MVNNTSNINNINNVNNVSNIKNINQFFNSLKLNYFVMPAMDKDAEANSHEKLGDVHYIKGDYARSLWHFKKAKVLGVPDDFIELKIIKSQEKISSDTSMVNTISTLNTINTTRNSYIDIEIDNFRLIPFEIYITFSFILFIAFLMVINFWINSAKFKTIELRKRGGYFFMMLFFSFIFALIPLFVYQLYISKQKFAVVLNNTTLKDGPSEIFNDSEEVLAGTKILVNKNYNGRYFIVTPTKIKGWILKKDVGVY